MHPAAPKPQPSEIRETMATAVAAVIHGRAHPAPGDTNPLPPVRPLGRRYQYKPGAVKGHNYRPRRTSWRFR